MLTSYEIIDPSTHVVLDKASDQNTLLQKNMKLRNLNQIIITSLVFITIGITYYKNQKVKQDNE